MSSITEWFVLRMPASADRNNGAARESEGVAGSVLNNDVVTQDSIGTIIHYDDLGLFLIAHIFLSSS